MNNLVIETQGLTRYFGKKRVVAPLNLTVQRGSILGLLGRNGAGKSTTIRMLMGLLEPTRGSATVLGHDCTNLPPQVRGRIGYLAEGHHVYGWMTVAECARFQSQFFTHWNSTLFDGVVRHFNLEPQAKAGTLSRGQRAGLCLALTLAPEPELLILDDPALGLDPVARRSLLEAMLLVTRSDERTIVFSSHLLSDVERVADHLAVMDKGVLRASCPIETFRERVRQFVLYFADGVAMPPNLSAGPALPGLLQSLQTRGELSLTFANYNEATEAAVQRLGASRIEEVPLSLEEALIAYLRERGEHSFLQQIATREEKLESRIQNPEELLTTGALTTDH